MSLFFIKRLFNKKKYKLLLLGFFAFTQFAFLSNAFAGKLSNSLDNANTPNQQNTKKFNDHPKILLAKKRRSSTLRKPPVVKEINGEKLTGFYSKSAYLIDHSSNKIIYDKNADIVSPIASVTKLMTAMVVLDAKLDLEEVISISSEDIDTVKHSRSHLSVGFRIRRGHAILLALMSSDNRAANALARHYPTGFTGFIKAMNEKAKQLGMHSTNFEDATGLSYGNVSSPRDLASMVTAANSYPIIRQYSTTPNAKVRYQNKTINFVNTNAEVRKLDKSFIDIVLSKTGYISESGFCLVMTGFINSRAITVVFMDAKSSKARLRDIANIKNWVNALL